MEDKIGSIMQVTMENIRDMVDVNTVVGDPVTAMDGTTIIPVSKVTFGYLAGGGEYSLSNQKKIVIRNDEDGEAPFAGGSGAGVSVQPVGFLVCSENQVKMLCAQPNTSVDRMLELIPQLIGEFKDMCKKPKDGKSGRKESNRGLENTSEPSGIQPGSAQLVNYTAKSVPET